MSDPLNKALATAVLRLLRPLVRILLRNGVPCGAVADLVRRSYVDVAWYEFAPEGRKQTVSRVSALTGLTRKEVKRLNETADSDVGPDQARYSRAIRVISGWLHDRQFQDNNGKPAELPVDGARRSFAALAKKYSGDVPARAMLDALVEAGSASVSGGRVRLVRHAYVPGRDEVGKIEILGIDAAELIATIDHNLTAAPAELHFQRKAAYDNIDPAALERLRSLSSRKAQSLLESLDGEFARYHLDADTAAGGKYISVGIYYYERDAAGQDRSRGRS